jgi:ABC-type sugar transport system permease subunit
MVETRTVSSRNRLGRIGRFRKSIQENLFQYLLIAPLVGFLLSVVWFPAAQGVYMSLFEWPVFGEKTFIGLGNYEYLLSWDPFFTSLKATLVYGMSTIGHLVIGTGLALIVWHQDRFKGATSLLFLTPLLFPTVVTGALWRFLLHPNTGPIFDWLVGWGILSEPIYWLSSSFLALLTVTGVAVWTWSSFVFLLIYASLEGIPASYYESAKIYGAGTVERFWYITLPEIKTGLLVATVLRVVYNLGKVAQPLAITGGGPGWDTSVLGMLLYRLAWQRQEFGLAFAVGIVLSAITVIFIGWFIWKFESVSEGVDAV